MPKGEPLEHGGDLRAFAGRFNLRENEVMDFSSNINPLGIPESVRRLYLESAGELTRYPDPSSGEFCREVTRHFPVKMENVIAGNGSMALLGLTMRVLAPQRALLIEPCFSEYRRLLEQQGTEVHSFLLKEEDGFHFNLSKILDALPAMDLLILGHPNNPTGTALSRPELLELITQAERYQAYVLVDEAFADWIPELSVADAVKERSNLIVVRSLTKFFALAGIRSGFALGPSSVIAALKRRQETWSVNRLAEKLSVSALQDSRFQTQSRQWFEAESRWFHHALGSLGAFKVYPSLANFFLVRHLYPENHEGLNFLGEKGIYLRAAGNFKGLDPSYFRIALRRREENKLLIENFCECLHLSLPSCSIS